MEKLQNTAEVNQKTTMMTKQSRAHMCKKTALFAVIAVCMAPIFGCGRGEIVDNLSQEEQGGRMGIGKTLGIPGACDITMEISAKATKSIKINDNNIKVPDTDEMRTYTAKRIVSDEERVRQIVTELFDSDAIYTRDDEIYTRFEIEEAIAAYKENMKDESTGMSGYWEDEIKKLEVKLPNAPDELSKVTVYTGDIAYVGEVSGRECEIVFESDAEHSANDGETVVNEDETDKPYIDLYLSSHAYDQLEIENDSRWVIIREDSEVPIDISDMKNQTVMSEDEIYSKAMNVASIFGAESLSQEWIQSLIWSYADDDYNYRNEVNGYEIRLTRVLDGAEIYTEDTIMVSNLEDVEIDLPCEYVDVEFVDGELLMASARLYTDDDTLTVEDTKLLSWNDLLICIQDAAEKYYKDYPSGYSEITFDEISLQYILRKSDNDEYVYMPVWILASYDDDEEQECGNDRYPTQLMIVDAVTGEYIL